MVALIEGAGCCDHDGGRKGREMEGKGLDQIVNRKNSDKLEDVVYLILSLQSFAQSHFIFENCCDR